MKRILYILILCSLPLLVNSQPKTGPGDPPPPNDDVPITGIEILLAAGGLFGAKRIYDGSRKKK